MKHDPADVKIQLVKATISSTIGFGLDFALLVLLVEFFGMHYLVAATIGFTVGTTVVYIFSVQWIFPKRALRRKSLEYGLFIAVGLVGAALNDFFLWLFTEPIGIHYMASRLISASLVFFWNFFARKRLLFK